MTVERTKYMSREEVQRLRSTLVAEAERALKRGLSGAVRSWALIDTALGTGLRVSELVKLDCGDVDLERGALGVWRSKRRTQHRETIALGNELRAHLAEYLAWKESVGERTGEDDPLFSSGRAKCLSVRGAQHIFKVAAAKAGLSPKLSIHSCRHSLAVALLSKTKNLRQVQKQLGHASPVITANLYADVTFEEMAAGVTGLYEESAAS